MRQAYIILLFTLISSFAIGQTTADFGADTTSGCTPVTVNFKDLSKGTIVSWYWTFGNGNTSTKKNPSAIFYKPGTYTISLKVTDDKGNVDTKTKSSYIEVFELPTADFSPLKTSGCAPLAVPFSNKSKKGSGAINDITWDFGDGNTLNSTSGYHVYKFPGTYSVSMLVVDANKCKDKIKKDNIIEVYPVPVVDYEADETYECNPPLKVNFKNLTTKGGTGFTYEWDFGDGNKSTSKDPTHEYKSNGNYTVTLTVTNSKGCKTTVVKKSYININPIDVDFDISDKEGCAPLEVTFTNKTTPDVSGLTFSWKFGNGGKAQTKHAVTTYDKPGSYDIVLTVSKKGKCTQTRTYANAIVVTPSPDPDMFVQDTTACAVPFDVIVKDKGSGSTSWVWMLNGQQKTTTQDATISITTMGAHVISMVAKNNYGCVSDTFTKLIQVTPIEVTATPDTSGCAPYAVLFKNTSNLDDHNIASQSWDFGDGTTKEITGGSPTQVSHFYKDPGTYAVTLKVVTDEGCEGIVNLTVKLGKKREPKIESGIDTLCNSSQGIILNETDNDLKDSIDKIVWKLLTKSGKTSHVDSAQRNQFGYKWNFKFDVKEKDTGYYDALLITEDRGCFDTTLYKDRIYILPPVAKLKKLHDTCANDIMILANISKHYDSIHWVVNKHLHFDSIITIGTDTAKRAKLMAFNSTSKCIDSAEFKFEPKQTFSGGFTSNGDLCAPAKFNFTGSASDSYLSYLWIINDKDSFFTRRINTEFLQPGTQKVYYRATDTSATGGCARAMEISYDITGPTVEGSIIGDPGCGPIDVYMSTTSNPKNYSSLTWNIGKYTIPIGPDGKDTFELFQPGPDDGKWPISLVGIDSNGCKGSKEFETEVYGTKNASLKITRFKDCDGLKFIFSPLFNTPVDDENWKYSWDFGDGESSDLKVISHTFKKPGKFVVRVYMTDENNCVTRLQDTVDIADEVLTAKFYADSLIKDCPPLHVGFEDRSTLNSSRKIVSWQWDFGDGTGSQERYPKKLYLKSGSYDVSLKVVDEWGCEDSFNYPGFVLVRGPVGSYVFDKTEGCVPLDVTFTADTSRCSGFTWDFGDGNILKNQIKVTHTYQDTGRFIPLLTLSDTFGCTYTHPPIDTIYVYPLPIPDFGMSRPCPGVPTKFSNNSWPYGSLANVKWDFGDGQTSTDFYPNNTYSVGGKYPVNLEVTTRNGCTKDTTKYVEIKKINADFSTETGDVCVGSKINIKDQSETDSKIVSWQWTINDTFNFSGQNPSLTFTQVGPVKLQLIVEDDIGCTDTLRSSNLLRVGDTIPPVPTDLLRVSVLNDYSYLADWKRSTITDFKSYLIYSGDDVTEEIYDQDILTATVGQVNTLHNVYCSKVAVRNSCGLISAEVADAHDCTVEVSAKGELNQSRLNWNAYEGWGQVETYYIYRADEVDVLDYRLIDSVNGNTFEYVDTNILCYQKHRYKILAKEFDGNSQVSWSDTCEATPIYVNSIPPNELVRATVQHDDYIRIEWLATPFSKMPIDHYILEKSSDGNSYRIVDDNISSDIFDMDDQAVEVDSQSYYYRVRAVDVCEDEAPYSNLAKTILLKADTGKFQRPVLNWSFYEGWDVGVDKYEIQRKEEDGSFTSLGFTSSGNDSVFYDKVTRLNERPHFCYRVIGYKNDFVNQPQVVSVSNEDCINVHSWLFVPNAFSPNDDGLNDYFVTPGWYIKDYHISIYTRWGEKIFESNSLYRSWSGKYKGEIVENEAYVYIIESIGIDNIKRNYKGTVTVLR